MPSWKDLYELLNSDIEPMAVVRRMNVPPSRFRKLMQSKRMARLRSWEAEDAGITLPLRSNRSKRIPGRAQPNPASKLLEILKTRENDRTTPEQTAEVLARQNLAEFRTCYKTGRNVPQRSLAFPSVPQHSLAFPGVPQFSEAFRFIPGHSAVKGSGHRGKTRQILSHCLTLLHP